MPEQSTTLRLKQIARQALNDGHDDIAERAIRKLKSIEAELVPQMSMSADEADIRYPTPKERPPVRIATNMGGGFIDVDVHSDEAKQAEELRKLAQVNPQQAEIIANMSPLDRMRTGVGSGMNEMLGLIDEYNPVSALNRALMPASLSQNKYDSTAGMSELKKVDPSVGSAESVGQGVPLIAGGALSTLPRTFGGRLAVAPVIGAGEGASLAKVNDESVLGGAVAGAVLAPLLEVAGLGITRAANKVVSKYFGKAKAIDENGQLTPEFYAALEKEGVTPDQFLKAAETKDKKEFLASMVDAAQIRRFEDIANNVAIDPKRRAAAETLGIDDVPLGVMSNQPKVYELAGALAAQPTSSASESLLRINQTLSTKADELIRDLGGSTDKAATNSKILGEMDDFIAKSAETENAIHKQITEKIGNPIINPKPLLNDILESAKKSKKGVAGLSEVEQEVFETLKDKNTYFDLDNLRKKIGAALGKETSTYTNTSRRDLSQMYSKLTQLQEGVAKQFGADELWNQSKEIAKKRFDVQDAVVAAFGRDKMQSIVPKIEKALLSTTKEHDIGGMVKVMRQLEPEQQKEVMATALNGIFTSKNGVDRAYTATHLQKIGDSLERSPTSQGLIKKYLGDDGYRRLDAMIELSRGVANVTRNKVKTGLYAEDFKKFENTGMLVKALYGTAGVAEKAVPYIGKPVRKLAIRLDEKAADGSTFNPAIDAVDNLLDSNNFRSYILANAKGDAKDIELRTARLKSSKEYKEFMKVIPENSRSGIVSAGLLPVLMSYDEAEE